jgi:acyl carrier protein
MMTLEEFTRSLEGEMEEIAPGTLTPDTSYRQMKNWSSMHALIIIAFVDLHFNTTLSGSDLRSANTIRDLYNVVLEKKKSV